MSQMTVTGRREREVGEEVCATLRLQAIDNLVDDLLNARAHVVDATRSKGPDHKAAQPAMVGWIEQQHPMAHAAIDRLLENLRPGASGNSADEVLAEAFVPQDCGDLRMTARDVESERC
jgi:hypothetical protein